MSYEKVTGDMLREKSKWANQQRHERIIADEIKGILKKCVSAAENGNFGIWHRADYMFVELVEALHERGIVVNKTKENSNKDVYIHWEEGHD